MSNTNSLSLAKKLVLWHAGWRAVAALRPACRRQATGLDQFVIVLRAGWFWLLDLGGLGFRGSAFEVQGKQVLQDLFVCKIGGPAVGGGHGGIQFLMGEVQPGGALVVEVREGALPQVRVARQ